MTTNPPHLPSTVEETLAVCPKFRILVVGNTGVGKSSLVSSVFNISISDIDIAHDRAGKADIAREYTSDANPRFILHDSQGFEPGSVQNWDVADRFIRDKCDEHLQSKDRLHAIWLCIETPRTGSRLMQTADEMLLSLASELKVAVIVVFTKYDMLFNQYYRKAKKPQMHVDEIRAIAKRDAEDHFNNIISHSQLRTDCVTVSTHNRYPERLSMLRKLTEITRKSLHDVEGDLWIPWATAQQINAQQKVNFSIDEGFKKYWINLGKSAAFQGEILWDCLSRIHEDLLEVWNFNDPQKLLSGEQFRAEMVKLIEPLLTESPEPSFDLSRMLSNMSDLASVAGAIATTFAQALSGAGIAVIAIKFLCQKYQAIWLTALCLGAYIVDLTLILHNLFIATLTMEPPRSLSRELVKDTLKSYKDSDSAKVHRHIRSIPYGTLNPDPKEKIADLIRKQLNMVRE